MMSNRKLVEAAKDILRYVVISNKNTIPITLTKSAKVVLDHQRENELEDVWNTIQMEEGKTYNTDRMRTEMGDVL
tara:strand:- start:88 stop:312 length:225 start_codon:yes stop_codon:yes gene_type:complete